MWHWLFFFFCVFLLLFFIRTMAHRLSQLICSNVESCCWAPESVAISPWVRWVCLPWKVIYLILFQDFHFLFCVFVFCLVFRNFLAERAVRRGEQSHCHANQEPRDQTSGCRTIIYYSFPTTSKIHDNAASLRKTFPPPPTSHAFL